MIEIFRARIAGAVLANGFARSMRLVEQFILVPMLLAAWGIERYGEWIALFSLAAFAGLANLGIGHAAAADIVIQHARGERVAAARSLLTAAALTTAAAGAGLLLLIGGVAVSPDSLIPLKSIPVSESHVILVVVGVAALLAFYVEPISGVIAAVAGAGLPSLILGCTKALEIAGIGIALYLGAGPTAVAFIMLAGAVLTLAILLGLAIRLAPWLSFRAKSFDAGAIRRTWKAALGFYCLYISINIGAIHLVRLIISHQLGAEALSIFAVFVTYVRAARLVAVTFSQAAQVEVGRTFGSGQGPLGRELVETMLAGSLAIASVIACMLMMVAPFVIPAWTGKQVSLAWDLLGVLAVTAVVGAYFDAAHLAAAALNRIARIAVGHAAALAVALVAMVLLLPATGSLAVAAACMLLPEIGGAIAATRVVNRMVEPPKIRAADLLNRILGAFGRARRPKLQSGAPDIQELGGR